MVVYSGARVRLTLPLHSNRSCPTMTTEQLLLACDPHTCTHHSLALQGATYNDIVHVLSQFHAVLKLIVYNYIHCKKWVFTQNENAGFLVTFESHENYTHHFL